MDRLGIFGGTFDPPHCGHVALAEEAANQLELDLVLWVLTPDPPHKRGRKITPWPFRLKMVEAAIANNPRFLVSRVDIDRQPPHYALDTVQLIRQSYPSAKLIYLLGEDSLRDLPTWHEPKLFVASVDGLGVMRRHHVKYDLDVLEKQLDGVSKKILWIDARLQDVSSTRMRKTLYKEPDCPAEMPDTVYEIIKEHHLYRT